MSVFLEHLLVHINTDHCLHSDFLCYRYSLLGAFSRGAKIILLLINMNFLFFFFFHKKKKTGVQLKPRELYIYSSSALNCWSSCIYPTQQLSVFVGSGVVGGMWSDEIH